MSFAKMQEALRAEGWFVEWNMPCCQSCAWGSIPFEHEVGPFKGQQVDLSKVLFNHSQDCEVYTDGEECTECHGEGEIENADFDENEEDSEEYIYCPECGGMGEIDSIHNDFDASEFDTSVSGFVCQSPEQQTSSMLCFDSAKEGVANLNLALKIIDEAGCKIMWNGRGDSRPDISWK